jgi:hypothetical protein
MVARDLVASVFETKVTRRIPLVDQKLLTLLGQLMSTFFVAFLLLNITFFYVVFVDQHLSLCPISLGHHIVCYSLIDLRLLVTSFVSSDVYHLTC